MVAAILLLTALAPLDRARASELPPRPDGPVYDGGDILSPDIEAQLDQQLRAYNAQTGRAIIVATVPDLGGDPIEGYATDLFANWGIGGEKRDQGLLLLVARDDRKMRIEVGYGLHPYFGGVMAGRVIRDVITPRFKQGDFDAGVTEGIGAIVNHLAKSPEDAIAIEEAAQAAEAQRENDGGFPIGGLIWVGFIFFFFILPMMRGGRRRRRYRGKGREFSDTARDIILWEVGSAIVRGALSDGDDWGGGGGFGGGGFSGGGGGGFGGFGGGMSGGGGASGGW